jgi:hypothetical protein
MISKLRLDALQTSLMAKTSFDISEHIMIVLSLLRWYSCSVPGSHRKSKFSKSNPRESLDSVHTSMLIHLKRDMKTRYIKSSLTFVLLLVLILHRDINQNIIFS